MSKVSEAVGKFKKVSIDYDHSGLTDDVKNALPYLKKAMDGITRIFLRQQSEGLPDVYDEVMAGNDEEKKDFFKLFRSILLDHCSVFTEPQRRQIRGMRAQHRSDGPSQAFRVNMSFRP